MFAYGIFQDGQDDVQFCYLLGNPPYAHDDTLEDALWENIENTVSVAYHRDREQRSGMAGCCYDHVTGGREQMTEIEGHWIRHAIRPNPDVPVQRPGAGQEAADTVATQQGREQQEGQSPA